MGEYEKANPMDPDTFNEHNSFWTGSGIRSTFENVSQDKWNKIFGSKMQVNLHMGRIWGMRLRRQWNVNMENIRLGMYNAV